MRSLRTNRKPHEHDHYKRLLGRAKMAESNCFPLDTRIREKPRNNSSNRLYTTTYKTQQRAHCSRDRPTRQGPEKRPNCCRDNALREVHEPHGVAVKVKGGERLHFGPVGQTPPRTETLDAQHLAPIRHLGPDANCFRPRKKVSNNCRPALVSPCVVAAKRRVRATHLCRMLWCVARTLRVARWLHYRTLMSQLRPPAAGT